MLYFVGLDETGRILASTDMEEYAEDMMQVELPDSFDFSKQDEYRIENGKLIHDPRPISPESEIADLKMKLYETDYVTIKMYESSLPTGSALSESDLELYSKIMIQRQGWRDRINELERSL